MNEIIQGRTCGAMMDSLREDLTEYFQALLGQKVSKIVPTAALIEHPPLDAESLTPDCSGDEKVMLKASRHYQAVPVNSYQPIEIHLGDAALVFRHLVQATVNPEELVGAKLIGMEIDRNWLVNELGTDLQFTLHFDNKAVVDVVGWARFDPSRLQYRGRQLPQEFAGDPLRIEADPDVEPEMYAAELLTAIRRIQTVRNPRISIMTDQAYLNELNSCGLYPKNDGVYASDGEQEFNLTDRYRQLGYQIHIPKDPKKRAALELPGGHILVYEGTRKEWIAL
jgi:hypothetical protein